MDRCELGVAMAVTHLAELRRHAERRAPGRRSARGQAARVAAPSGPTRPGR